MQGTAFLKPSTEEEIQIQERSTTMPTELQGILQSASSWDQQFICVVWLVKQRKIGRQGHAGRKRVKRIGHKVLVTALVGEAAPWKTKKM
jgi:hypothetical protein